MPPLNTHGMQQKATAGAGEGSGLLKRMEQKTQMKSQLGSFLTLMQHESEETAPTWLEELMERPSYGSN